MDHLKLNQNQDLTEAEKSQVRHICKKALLLCLKEDHLIGDATFQQALQLLEQP